jgi:tight adherence protein B
MATGPVGAALLAAYAAAGVRAGCRRRRAREDADVRAAGADALAGLADDVRAGLPPSAALGAALDGLAEQPGVRASLSTLDAAGDVVPALRAVAGPLAPAMGRLAAAWALTDAGVPLADVVDRLDEELRAAARAAERMAAQTASARATARLVAALPVVGLAIGAALGADPVRVLTGTVPGAACAVAAAVLHLVGFAWAGRIATAVHT